MFNLFTPVQGLRLIKGIIEGHLKIDPLLKYSMIYRKENTSLSFVVNDVEIPYPAGQSIAGYIADMVQTKLPETASLNIAVITYDKTGVEKVTVNVGYEFNGEKLKMDIDL
jgi:hypothetical protein